MTQNLVAPMVLFNDQHKEYDQSLWPHNMVWHLFEMNKYKNLRRLAKVASYRLLPHRSYIYLVSDISE